MNDPTGQRSDTGGGMSHGGDSWKSFLLRKLSKGLETRAAWRVEDNDEVTVAEMQRMRGEW